MSGARRSWLVALVIVLMGASFAAGYASHRSPGTTPSTTSPTTSTPPATSTSSGDATWMSLFPEPASATRYASPTGVAVAFARHVLKMASPVARAFQQGDTRSGEVPIQANATGPVSTVLVRQLARDDSWWVLGAICGSLQIATPEAFSTVASPLRVSGRSTAFEAVINLALYQDGSSTPLATGTAMGGSMGEMGPFATSLSFSGATSAYGVLVVYTRSAKDGSVLEASAIRVRFS